jgi:transcriptional regulator GlxA family with amidase domain
VTTHPTKTVAFVVYPGLTPLDLVGPLQLLAGLGAVDPDYDVTVVGRHRQPMPTDVPLELRPTRTFDDVPDPHILVVPGGGVGTIEALADPDLRNYISAAAPGAHIVASVCTGSLILAAAGLLDGRRATTHWGYATFLERLGATYVPDRWVEDGKFITAAGVSAGIDLALHLGARLTSIDIARQAQLAIEYDPQPPFGPIEWEGVDRTAMVPTIEHTIRSVVHDDTLASLLLGEHSI